MGPGSTLPPPRSLVLEHHRLILISKPLHMLFPSTGDVFSLPFFRKQMLTHFSRLSLNLTSSRKPSPPSWLLAVDRPGHKQ